MLRKGVLDDRQIDVDLPHQVPQQPQGGVIQLDQSNPISINDFLGRFNQLASQGKGRSERKRMAIRDARPLIEEQELEKLLEGVDINREAVASVEESGIVFIDEIDKIVNASDYRGADASAEGVQRDLLPLIEGSTIQTKRLRPGGIHATPRFFRGDDGRRGFSVELRGGDAGRGGDAAATRAVATRRRRRGASRGDDAATTWREEPSAGTAT